MTKKTIYVRRVRPKALDLRIATGRREWASPGKYEAGVLSQLARTLFVKSAPLRIVTLLIGLQLMAIPVARAEHEVDHRFIVEGYVCSGDGKVMANQEVMVKDTRISLGKTTYTDSDGFYSVRLHLHNENQGDPILVAAGEREQHITAKFDPKDLKVERKTTVNFGSGCEGAQRGSGRWVYYGIGVGLAGIAAFAGAKMLRKPRRSAKRGKAQRK